MPDLFIPLAIGLGLGFLVGLQREWATREVAGIRTFPLITVLGVLAAALTERYGGWIFGAGLLGLAGVIVAGNLARIETEAEPDPGITTEVTALLMFAVGGMLASGFIAEGVVLGGIVAVLLHWKNPLHDFTERLDRSELTAVIRLALLGLVILPILPDRAFGPYEVLNPFRIWLMVVLIVGISLAGYVASRLLGARVGTLLAGILGGLISSTATTVSYARRTAGAPERAPGAAVVIVLASSVVFLRVLLEVVVVASDILDVVAPPLIAMMLWMIVISMGLYFWSRSDLVSVDEDEEPPSGLKAAVVFGALYAAVLLGVAFTRDRFGEGALYAVASLSGLTDVDAITLSSAELVRSGELTAHLGWRLILVGTLANLAFKGGAVLLLGDRALRMRVAAAFGLSGLGGALILAFWPGG